MKTIFFSLSLLMVIGLSSCRKCYECQVNAQSQNGIEYCEGEYNAEQLDAARDVCEATQGGNWISL